MSCPRVSLDHSHDTVSSISRTFCFVEFKFSVVNFFNLESSCHVENVRVVVCSYDQVIARKNFVLHAENRPRGRVDNIVESNQLFLNDAALIMAHMGKSWP